MAGITDFLKDIFMITPEKKFVGLSSIKPAKTKKKSVKKAEKKQEQKLSDLMRKSRLEV